MAKSAAIKRRYDTALAKAVKRIGVTHAAVLAPAAQFSYGSYRPAYNPRNRDKGVVDGTGNYHLDDVTRLRLRSLSRHLERNNDLYDGLLTNWSIYLVGSGPRPVPTSKNPDFNAAAAELFAEHAKAKRLDARRLFPWAHWVALFARAIARDGDAGVYHLEDGSAQLQESERIAEVLTDGVGRITGYRLANELSSGNSTMTATGDVIPAHLMSLAAWRKRPSQTRGEPVLTSGLDDWDRLDSLNEAEIISAESASLPWIVIKKQAGQYGASPTIVPGDQQAAKPPGAYAPDGWQRSDAGSMLGLPPGLDGTPWSPDRPNLNVPAFVRMNLRHLCLPLLPYEIAFLDIGDLNYAAIRGVGTLAKRKLADFRTHLLEDPLSRIYRDWARAQIIAKNLPFVPDFAAHRWEWDELDIRDRDKDATAVSKELENGTLTMQDELGPNWRLVMKQRDIERRYQAELDKAYAAEFPPVASSTPAIPPAPPELVPAGT